MSNYGAPPHEVWRLREEVTRLRQELADERKYLDRLTADKMEAEANWLRLEAERETLREEVTRLRAAFLALRGKGLDALK